MGYDNRRVVFYFDGTEFRVSRVYNEDEKINDLDGYNSETRVIYAQQADMYITTHNNALNSGHLQVMCCKDCGKWFWMDLAEIWTYLNKGLSKPLRCRKCRGKRRGKYV